MIRYSRKSDDELHAFLDQLVEQKHNGVATVSYNGETTTFTGQASIELNIVEIETEISRRYALRAGRARRSPVRVEYPRNIGKGFL